MTSRCFGAIRHELLAFVARSVTDDCSDCAAHRHRAAVAGGCGQDRHHQSVGGPVNNPCYAKALVLSQGEMTAVLVTVDAVAIGGIGAIRDTFMDSLRQELAKDPGIPPAHVIVNAS